MKEKILAQNRINKAVNEFILTIAENYNTDWKKISHKKYINLTKDTVLKALAQLQIEWSDEWND